MLKLKADPTFTVPVVIPVPGGSVTIKVEFKHKTRDEYLAFVKQEERAKHTDQDTVMEIACGWQGVDAPFSAEAVMELCNQYHAALKCIIETYIRELTQYKVGN